MSDLVLSSPRVLSALSELSSEATSTNGALLHGTSSHQTATDSGYMAASEGSVDSVPDEEDPAVLEDDEADLQEHDALLNGLQPLLPIEGQHLPAEADEEEGADGVVADAAEAEVAGNEEVGDSEEENIQAGADAVEDPVPQASSSSSSSSDDEGGQEHGVVSRLYSLKRRRVYGPRFDY
ncbi:hypothetical protein ACP70R_036902 [Stipagrostis hirtigluma subsp. patula]